MTLLLRIVLIALNPDLAATSLPKKVTLLLSCCSLTQNLISLGVVLTSKLLSARLG